MCRKSNKLAWKLSSVYYVLPPAPCSCHTWRVQVACGRISLYFLVSFLTCRRAYKTPLGPSSCSTSKRLSEDVGRPTEGEPLWSLITETKP